jgi:hypothetical protein
MEHAAEAAANVGVELDNVKENVKGFASDVPEGVFHASTAMTEFGSAIMSVSTMISSIQGAISVFSDEGATGFEKLGAAISIVTAAMAAFNSIQALSTTLSKSDAAAKLFSVLGYKMVKTESGALALVKTGETGAVAANTAAWYANPIMWIALIVVAAVAAFLLLVSAISAVTNALKSMTAEEKLKSAEAEATRLAEELDKAKTAADNLRSSIENYDTAVDKIKTLTEGTEEWRQSIEEANDAARKLIDEYGEELAGKYHFNAETGLIEFDKGALDDLQKIVDDNVKTV